MRAFGKGSCGFKGGLRWEGKGRAQRRHEHFVLLPAVFYLPVCAVLQKELLAGMLCCILVLHAGDLLPGLLLQC